MTDTHPPPAGQAPARHGLIRWLWRDYLWKRWPMMLAAVVLMAVEGGMLGALSFVVKPLFDDVFVARNAAAIGWGALAIGGIFALRALSGLGQQVLVAVISERAAGEMQKDTLAHLMRLDHAFYRTHAPGTLIERVRGDTGAVVQFFGGVVAPFGRDLVSVIALLGVALSIDWVWTLIAILGAPLMIGPVLVMQRLVRRTSRAARDAAARAATRLDEIFHGIVTVQLNGTEAREGSRYGRAVDDYVGAMVRATAGGAAIPSMMDVIAAIGLIGVLFYGGAEIIGGEKTLGAFLSFFTAIALVFEPLRRLGGVSAQLQIVLASLERVRALMDEPVRVTDPARPAAPPAVDRAGPIRFEGVTFAYAGGANAPALRGFDMLAEADRTTALVGPSGAGKTTVFTLLTRLADPQAGRITLGGTDVRDLALKDLRALFSVVSQEAALFDETLRDNILMGRSDVPEAQLRAAIEAAAVDEFLPRLPRGLDTPVGPRGSALSGGQRQRVAIARAILRDAPVLLLDEATSALDAGTEAAVQAALDRLSRGRTTLVIAHRLATVQGADRIVVMDRGRAADQGTHAELLARGGLYADLCRLQFADP